MKKEIVTKSIGLFIKEMFIFLAVRLVVLARDFVSVFVNQMAGQSEIARLNGETSLVFSEFIINHQTSFVSIFTVLVVLLLCLAAYVAIFDINKIMKINSNTLEEK